MSQNPENQKSGPADQPEPGLQIAAPRSTRKGRLIVLGVICACVAGGAGYLRWSADRNTKRAQEVAAALAPDGVEMSYGEATPTEGGMAFMVPGSMTKFVRVHSKKDNINDKMLGQIAEVNMDMYLMLNKCPISDAGLAVLKGNHHVRWLQLRDTKVTDQGLASLEGLNLESLDLSGNDIDDAGLKALCEIDFPHLNDLQLEKTKVTDAGIMHLARYKTLEWLSLKGTKVTRRGAKHLKEELPELAIWTN